MNPSKPSELSKYVKLPEPTKAGRLLAALEGRATKEVTIAGTDLRGRMELLGAAATLDVEGEVIAAMDRRGVSQTELNVGTFETEKALRTLARCVKTLDGAEPLGTVEEWGAVSVVAISDLWRTYGDMREELDPISYPLTADEVAAINEAVEKKRADLLRWFGVRRLAAWLTTSGGPHAIFSAPRSSPGDSSPAS